MMKESVPMCSRAILSVWRCVLALCSIAGIISAVPAAASSVGVPGVDFDSRKVYVVFKPGTSAAAIHAFTTAYAAAPLTPAQYFYGPHDIRSAYLVTLKAGINPGDIADALQLSQLHTPVERAARLSLTRSALQGRAVSAVGRLVSSPVLDMVTPQFTRRFLQTTGTTTTTTTTLTNIFGATPTPITNFTFPAPVAAPNDPLFPQQWALDANHMEAQTAWAISPAAGANVTVAVLDSGYDLTHEDLQTNIDISRSRSWTRPATDPFYYVITPEPFPNVISATQDLVFDHGTSVSGIITATHNNGLGISGLAYNAPFWFEKVAPSFRQTGAAGADVNAEALALQYVADHGARVVNISFGGFALDTQELSAIRYALARGVIIVAASGNSADVKDVSTHLVVYPAAIPGVWAIGASNYFNGTAIFSSYNAADFTALAGQTLLPTAHDVDFLAPGGSCPVIPTTTTTTGATTATTGATTATTGATTATTGATTATTGATTATTGATTATTATTGTTGATTATTATTGATTTRAAGQFLQATTATTGATTATTGATTATTGATTATTGATTATTGATTATTGATTATTGATTATTGATTATTGTTTVTLPTCPVCTTQGVETTTAQLNSGMSYDQLQGTSFASPHVAALAALILGRNPTLTPSQVYNIIASSCRPANTSEAQLLATPNCMAAATTTGTTGITTGATTVGTTAGATTVGTTAGATTVGTTAGATSSGATTSGATTGGNTNGGVSVTTGTTATTAGATTAGATTAGATTAGATTAGATTAGATTAGATTAGATTAGATTSGATTSGATTGFTTTTTGTTAGTTAGTTTVGTGIGATGLATPNAQSGYGVVDAARALALTPPLLVLGVSPAYGTVTANSTPTVTFRLDPSDMQGFSFTFNGQSLYSYSAPTDSTGALLTPSATPITSAQGVSYTPSTGILTLKLPFASQALPVPQNTPLNFTVTAFGGLISSAAPQTLTTSFTIQPFTLPAGISFFGIPFGLSGNAAVPQYVFSGATFNMARWDQSINNYRYFPSDTYSSFAPPDATGTNPTVPLPPAGIGYWVLVPQNTQLHVEGTDLPQTQYPIQLHTGWNQLANPFPYTIDWNGTQVSSSAGIQTIGDAGNARIVSSTAFEFTGRAYTSLTAPSNNALAIQAFHGFWVYAYQNATLLMAPNPLISGSDLP